MRNVRIRYEKSGCAKYISHLDLNRSMMRLVRRAGIPLWYTEGFNPHPYMNFALPLPLGQIGLNEMADIRIDGEVENADIFERLKNAAPEGIRITGVENAGEDFKKIASAKYEIKFLFESENEAQSFSEQAEKIMEGGLLSAEKKSKKGIKTINLCELVASFKTHAEEKDVKIEAVLAAGSEKNLNAALLCEALQKQTELGSDLIEIIRTALMNAEGERF